MDPNQNLSDTAAALRDGDFIRANELRVALDAWLSAGGFEPNWETEDASYVRGTLWKTQACICGGPDDISDRCPLHHHLLEG